MKKIPFIALTSFALLMPLQSQAAGDVEAGKAKAAMCAGCHGAAGISAMGAWPNLAGQQADYLAKQLKDFKSGARKDPTMEPISSGLSDDDINNLAAYYSSLPYK